MTATPPPLSLQFAADFLRALDASQATKRAYRSALLRFVRFLVGDEQTAGRVLLTRLERDSLVTFRQWLAEEAEHQSQGHPGEKRKVKQGYHTRTVRSSLVAVSRFLEWLDVNRKLPHGLSAPDMQAVLRNAKGGRRASYRPKPIREAVPLIVAYYAELAIPEPENDRDKRKALTILRNRAMTRTLFCAGLRAQELANVIRGDWDIPHGLVHVTGKGEKPRTVGLDEDTQAALKEYLAAREAYHGAIKFPDREPLFARHDPAARPGRELQAITTKTVWQVVTEAVESLKQQGYAIASSISPHDFRRYIATAMLSEGMKLEHVQDFLGHASPETTRVVYAHTWDEALQDAVATYRPALSDALKRAESKMEKKERRVPSPRGLRRVR